MLINRLFPIKNIKMLKKLDKVRSSGLLSGCPLVFDMGAWLREPKWFLRNKEQSFFLDLIGAALLTSEGSRIFFPPRNLIP